MSDAIAAEEAFVRVHGMIQVLMAVWDEERGWLTTKRGVIYGGRHGEPPMIEDQPEKIAAIIQPEVATGLRALQKGWRR